VVRYVDRPSTEVSVEVRADPATVWDLVVDVDLPSRFSYEFLGGKWLDEPCRGARFVGQNKHDRVGTWQTLCTVIEFDPHRRFAYAVQDVDNPSAIWSFTLTPSEQGTLLSMRAQLGPGPSGLSSAIERFPDLEEQITSERIEEWRANMERTLAGIKDLAERA